MKICEDSDGSRGEKEHDRDNLQGNCENTLFTEVISSRMLFELNFTFSIESVFSNKFSLLFVHQTQTASKFSRR